MKRRVGLIALGLVALLVAGCTSTGEESTATDGEIVNSSVSSEEPGTDFPIAIEGVRPGETIGVDFRGAVFTGTVSLQFLDPEGDVVWEETVDSVGPFVVNDVVVATSAISHQLGLAWDEGLEITYALGWQPGEFEQPFAEPIAALSGAGLVALAVAAVVYSTVRKIGWKPLALGAAIWLGAYFLEVALDAVLRQVFTQLTGPLAPETSALAWYVYLGATTAVVEVAAVYLLLRFTSLGKGTFNDATALGLGFGAAQAGVQGMLSLAVAVLALTQPEAVPLPLADVAVLNNPLYGMAVIAQHAGTMLISFYSLVLICYGVATARISPVVQAFGYKAAMGVVFSTALFFGGEELTMHWVAAIGLALWGALGVYGYRRVREGYPE